jgi:hypothetical protein
MNECQSKMNGNVLRISQSTDGLGGSEYALSSIVSRAIDKFWERRGINPNEQTTYNNYKFYSNKNGNNQTKEG